jgi:hypothetical protein
MKFTEILEELKKGKKATRKKWETAVDACSVYFIVYNQKKGKCEYYLDGRYDDEFVFVWDDITAEDWKIYEEPNQVWQPKQSEIYYSILANGSIDYTTYDSNNRIDKQRLSSGNCFKTGEEAEHMLKKIKIINKLRELSNINFNDTSGEAHYAIAYDSETNEISSNVSYYYKFLPFNIYFATKEDCKKAVETIGEENLKKYYFDIVEEDN